MAGEHAFYFGDVMITLNVFVKDGLTGLGIGDARVGIITRNASIQPCTRLTSGDGGANLYFNGPPFNPPLTVDIFVDAAGYKPWCTADAPIILGTTNIDYIVNLESFKLPFKPAPRVWAGNMCGIRADVEAVPGGSSDRQLVLSWFYDRYTKNSQQTIRETWKAKGITHILLSWPDSQAFGRTPNQFLATCKELISYGFYPCPMLCAKPSNSSETRTLQETIQNINLVLPLLLGVCPLFGVGWELSLWMNPIEVQELIDYLYPKILPTGAFLYPHFQQGYFAFQIDGGTTADFWWSNVGKLTGVLHQRDLSWDKPMYQSRIVDCLQRFNGEFTFPPNSGIDGQPFNFVALEITAQPQFDGNMSEEEGNSWGRTALDVPPIGQASVMGSGNGF